MKRYFSSVETQSTEKGKQKQFKSSDKALLNEKSDLSKLSEIKRSKNRSKPDSKWIENGNNAWLEYRDIYEVLFMFCK